MVRYEVRKSKGNTKFQMPAEGKEIVKMSNIMCKVN